MATVTKDLGIATAYGYAKSKGYTGTEDEFAQAMLDMTTAVDDAQQYAQDAEDAKDDAQASAESIEQSTAQIATNTSDIADLKSDLGNLKTDVVADITAGWVKSKYVNTNQSEGTVVTVPDKEISTANYRYIFLAVNKGDTYILTATGGGDARLYAWLDTDHKLLSKSDTMLTVTDQTLTATQDGYLVINANVHNPIDLKQNKTIISTASTYMLTDFGAVGNGVTDDTDAIQLALDTAKDIYVPEGTFLFSKTLFIRSGTHLHGEGASSVFQLADSFTLTPYAWREDSTLVSDHNRYPMIMIEPTENGCILENFKLRGQTAHFYDKNCEGLSIFGSNHIIDNLVVEKINFFPDDFSGRTANGAGYGIRIAGTTISVRNCTVNECLYEGIGLEDADTVIVENCNIGYSLQTGAQIHRNCRHIHFVNNTINCYDGVSQYNSGLTLHADTDHKLRDINITGNCIISSLIFANGGGENDVWISNNYMVSIGVNAFGEQRDFRKNWVITGNTFTSGGIKAKCDNLVITNNMFNANGSDTMIYAKTNKYLIDNNLFAGTASEVIIEPHN